MDSSALVKRYAVEGGLARIKSLADPVIRNLLIIARAKGLLTGNLGCHS